MHILTFHKAEDDEVLIHTQRCSHGRSRTGLGRSCGATASTADRDMAHHRWRTKSSGQSGASPLETPPHTLPHPIK